MFLTDDPIQKLEDDELGRISFVEQLTKSLLARDVTESLVISLDGLWGSGKSSVLNLLETKIKTANPKDTSIFRFDPWYFNSTEKLLQTFLDEITRIVEKKVTEKTIKKKIKKYKKVLTSVQFAPKVSFFGVELSLGSFDINLENPQNLRIDIKNSIAKAKMRVIILIDNIDRLDIAELLLIFKLVRLCSDFPGFTFILALDKQQILKLLENSQIPFEFIDKIIQVDIKLPTIEQYRIDAFFNKGLDYISNAQQIIFDDFFRARFSQIYQSTIVNNLITTLRDAKRLLNTANFSLPIVKGEVDYTDFLVLQVIRVFFPDIYELLPKFKIEFTRYEMGGVRDEWRDRDKIAGFKELNEKIIVTTKNNPETANHLLGFLFPNYLAYLKNPQRPAFNINPKEFEKQQLIASSTHFDRYFTMRVSVNDIPTNAILEFIERLNEIGERVNINDQFILKYKETKNLLLALKKLDLYIDKLNEKARLHLIYFLINNSVAFDNEMNRRWETEISSAIKIVIDCLLFFSEEKQLELINEIIVTSPSLLFSLLIAEDCFLVRWYPFTEALRKTALEDIRARIHKDLLEENIDIFDTYPNNYSTIFGGWRSKEFLNEEEMVKQYTRGLLEKKPINVIKILSMYVWVYAGTDTPSHFDFGEFLKKHDPTEIKAYLDRVDLTGLAFSKQERMAIDEFYKNYSLTNQLDA